MLGEIVVGITEIAAIVATAKEIVQNVDVIMKETRNILKALRSVSDGTFARKLDDLGDRLLKIFTALITAFRNILDAISEAMRLNEKTDREGAALLANAIK